jgi:signal peptidase I
MMVAQDTPAPAAPATRPRRWWAALLLGLLTPGLGQVYNGEGAKGLAVYALGWLGIALGAATALAPIPLSISLMLLALSVLLTWGAAVESAWTAHRAGLPLRPRRYNRWYVYLAAFMLSWGISRVALVTLRSFVQSFAIPSASMLPTIQIGDHVFVDKARFRGAAPRRGDLIVHRSPENPNVTAIKRAVAVGGDRVEIRDKRLFVNGREVLEPYAIHNDAKTYPASPSLPYGRRDNFGPIVVPPGSLFALGDNRDNSFDCRFFGPISQSLVDGGGRVRVYWSRNPVTGDVRWDRIGRFLR